MAHCLACLRPITGLAPGQPPICIECWPKLTVVERSQLLQAEDARVTLRAILAMLKGNRETDELTRAADKIELQARRQAEQVVGMRADVLEFLEWFRDWIRTEGGEEWRRSLRDDENH